MPIVRVEAFDADTLEPVWISEDTESILLTSKMTYKNKKLYFGTGRIMEILIPHIMY